MDPNHAGAIADKGLIQTSKGKFDYSPDKRYDLPLGILIHKVSCKMPLVWKTTHIVDPQNYTFFCKLRTTVECIIQNNLQSLPSGDIGSLSSRTLLLT
jgi:hypothetical protein